MINGATQGLCSQPVIGISCHPDLTGRLIDELRLQLFRAMAGYWLDWWSTVPTAAAAFLGASTGPIAALTFRCAAGGTVPFLALEKSASAKNSYPTGVLAAGMSYAMGT